MSPKTASRYSVGGSKKPSAKSPSRPLPPLLQALADLQVKEQAQRDRERGRQEDLRRHQEALQRQGPSKQGQR